MHVFCVSGLAMATTTQLRTTARLSELSLLDLKIWASQFETQLKTRAPRVVEVDALLPPSIAQHYWTYSGPDKDDADMLSDDDVVTQTTSFLRTCLAFREGRETDLFERVYWSGSAYHFVTYKPQLEIVPFHQWWKSAEELPRREILSDLEEITRHYHEHAGAPFGALVAKGGALGVYDHGYRRTPEIVVTRFSAIGSGSLLADRIALDNLLMDILDADLFQEARLSDQSHWRRCLTSMKCVTCGVIQSIWNFSKCSSSHSLCNDCVRRLADHKSIGKASGSLMCPFPGSCEFTPYVVASVLSESSFEELVNLQFQRSKRHALHEGAITESISLLTSLVTGGIPAAIVNVVRKRMSHPSCPACGQAFMDFEGCAAVECAVCKVAFCGWCGVFTGTSEAVHKHVKNSCRFRPRGDTSDYGKEERSVTSRRLTDDLLRFLEAFSIEDQLAALAALRQDESAVASLAI